MDYKTKIDELNQNLESIQSDPATEYRLGEVIGIMSGSNNELQEDEVTLLRATEYGFISHSEADVLILSSFKTYKK